MQTFAEKVLSVVSEIPRGKMLTYKEVAKMAGNKDASRAVGTICAQNKNKKIPCHRVIRSNGTLGIYNGLRGKSKEKLLTEEKAI
jgi:O-6-methylguanine DNA methyltransferase